MAETMGEGSRDYTLNRVDVYDTIEDSPISLSECVPNTSYDTYQTWKFILLDMNVTNTSESEMEPRTGEEYQFMLDLRHCRLPYGRQRLAIPFVYHLRVHLSEYLGSFAVRFDPAEGKPKQKVSLLRL